MGIIGAGSIGGTVARLAVHSGWGVALAASRGPEALQPVVDTLGPLARAVDLQDVASQTDLVVVAVPVHAYATLPTAALANRVVIDTGNYSPSRDGAPTLLMDNPARVGRWLATLHPKANVVRCFNTVHYEHLARLARATGAPDRSTLPLAGDDDRSVGSATRFVDEIGFDSAVIGGLDEEWRLAPGQPAFGLPWSAGADFAVSGPTPANHAAVVTAVAGANR